MHTHRYISWYDNAISKDYCEHLIQKFHDNKDACGFQTRSNVKHFDQINYTEYEGIFGNDVEYLMGVFMKYTVQYIQDHDLPKWQFPLGDIGYYHFEDFRHKNYQPDVGEFKDHSDATTPPTSSRYLVMFIYLEDGEGGETVLLDQELPIERKAGRLLMFPPLWTYPHRANVPRGNEKNIIGSYLLFKPMDEEYANE